MTPKSGRSSPHPVPDQSAREQLDRVLRSKHFVPSPRLSRFLAHIVNRTLQGSIDSLKEFSIAMEVFDRSADYDSNIDAIVRVEARRLRTKLKAYYQDALDSSKDPVRIELPTGTYVPVFTWNGSNPESPSPPSQDPPRPRSVAVLPFVNMSPEPEQDYFCDGISEEIINRLTRVAGLNVIARTSSFQFKGIGVDVREVGQRLGADLLIEGSVRKAGDLLRITAQAIESESGHHLWSESFRREMNDVFAIQEEIAQAIASLLQVQAPTLALGNPNFDAYNRYLRCRFLIHQQTAESLAAATGQLRELIAAYPDYAPGYSGLAAALGTQTLFGFLSGRKVYNEIQSNAERGYQLEPNAAETCTVLAAFLGSFSRRWEEAELLFDRALQLQPAYSPAYVYGGMAALCQGRIDRAEQFIRRSMELDPLSASDCARLAYIHYLKGENGLARAQIQQSLRLDRDYPEALFYQGLLYFAEEDFQSVVDLLSSSDFPLDVGLMAAAHARLGQQSSVSACLDWLCRTAQSQYVTPLAFGLAAIGSGELDLAFQHLSDAVDDNTNFINLLGVDPFFHSLRKDGRFTKLLSKLRLADKLGG